MSTVIDRAPRLAIITTVAAALAVVLALLGSGHDPSGTSEPASASASSSVDHERGPNMPAVQQTGSTASDNPLLTCVGLLCLLALVLLTLRLRNRSGSWPSPPPVPGDLLTCTPRSDPSASPHLCARLIR